jgi:3-oxoadipate enol-lactonase
MPFAETGPVKLHYERHGRRPAVLLVMGLGMTLGGWWPVPVLARAFRVLTFDNRGIGRSDSPALPYSVAQGAAALARRPRFPIAYCNRLTAE